MFKNIIKTIANAILLIDWISSTSAYSVRPNIDFYGGDMYPIYSVNNSLSCLSYCESVRNCRLLTWCDNVCYIKNKKVSEVEKLDCISIDMYPDDKIINSSDSGSMQGSNSGSGDNQKIISIDDLNITQMPTTDPTPTTINPIPTTANPTPESTNLQKTTNNSNSAKKLTIYASSIILSIIVLF